MAKRNLVEVPAKRNRNQKKSEIEKKENKSKGQNSKNKSKSKSNSNKGRKTATDDASSEENDVLVAPSSSTGSGNDDVAESSEAEDDLVGEIVETKKPKINVETKKSKIKEENKPPPKRKSENEDAKNKGKKRSKKEENDADAESDAEEKSENAFPMNRISRIIRGDNPGIRISQEAVFLINRASEKFLQLFCREAYACTFLEDKTYTAYNHLSSVVAKQTRFGFLSDFVPEKVKAGDSLAQIPEAEK